MGLPRLRTRKPGGCPLLQWLRHRPRRHRPEPSPATTRPGAEERIEANGDAILAGARDRGWGGFAPFAHLQRAELAEKRGDSAQRAHSLSEAAEAFRAMGATRRVQAVEARLAR